MKWMSARKSLVVSLAALAGVLFAGEAQAAAAAKAPAPKAAAAQTLVKVHTQNGVKCADCHGKAKKPAPVEMDRCVTCHDTKELAAKTANVQPQNPHENRHYGTELDCNKCHHQHKKSENFCLQCHPTFKFAVP